MMRNETNGTCAVEVTLNLIGGQWKPLILYNLAHVGTNQTLSYSDIQQHIAGITPEILSRELRELETNGLIIRKKTSSGQPDVDYRLSALGNTTIPLLESMCAWGSMYRDTQLK